MNVFIEPRRVDWADIMRRPEIDTGDMDKLVSDIFEQVRSHGDHALSACTQKFDQAIIESVLVSEDDIAQAEKFVPADLKLAINKAATNIDRFHRNQIFLSEKIETSPGVMCWQESRAIEKVGIYIPGGTAPLFSTVLMLAIPAAIAGCREVILCSPPDVNGNIHPAILYAAKITGVTKIARVGGIQAIAALTFGTESIPEVYKIFGPGNQYVAAAKQRAFGMGIAIDLPAGPSELLVLADETSVPAFVAADLLSQAEHGPDSQVICICNNDKLIREILCEVCIQMEALPRKEIVKQALKNSKMILFRDKQESIDFINDYAPEHLILCTRQNDFYTKGIMNAGSVFIGNYTPESAGDYASGTNHTLPTNGYAKAFSGVGLDAFVKKVSFQQISKAGILDLGNAIELMAIAEGLQGHSNAVTLRLNQIKKEHEHDV